MSTEGYLYVTWGKTEYLKHSLVSLFTLRRYDCDRPIAIATDEHLAAYIKEKEITLFDDIIILKPEHRSIVGFKHNFHEYLVYDKTLYLDSDIVWCRNPDTLWKMFDAYEYTITGNFNSDFFFGARKDFWIVKDILTGARKKTLRNLGQTYIGRVQSGLMYAENAALAQKVGQKATEFLNRRDETHFQNRANEHGRNEDSCEWSLALAMAALKVPVMPWIQGMNSPQLDFIEDFVEYNDDFSKVTYTLYTHSFTYYMRGIRSRLLWNILFGLANWIPKTGEYITFTPFCLHFGWYHQKQPFFDFTERIIKHYFPNLD